MRWPGYTEFDIIFRSGRHARSHDSVSPAAMTRATPIYAIRCLSLATGETYNLSRMISDAKTNNMKYAAPTCQGGYMIIMKPGMLSPRRIALARRTPRFSEFRRWYAERQPSAAKKMT